MTTLCNRMFNIPRLKVPPPPANMPCALPRVILTQPEHPQLFRFHGHHGGLQCLVRPVEVFVDALVPSNLPCLRLPLGHTSRLWELDDRHLLTHAANLALCDRRTWSTWIVAAGKEGLSKLGTTSAAARQETGLLYCPTNAREISCR